MGAVRGSLKYMSLPTLVELKLAAGRLRDDADVLELARENPNCIDELRRHLAGAHAHHAQRFEEILTRLADSAD
jgi:hypothetical protein